MGLPYSRQKGSERYNPIFTELQDLLNVILHSLNSFAIISNSDIVAKKRFVMGLTKAVLLSPKKFGEIQSYLYVAAGFAQHHSA